ncbi:ABC transporter ATP-binding protein [Paenibacillus sp. FSL R7-0179]
MSQGVHATASRLQQHMGNMTEKMTDTINGASTIKMYQMKKWMVREYSENNRMATSAALDNNFRYALLDSTNYIFSWIVQVSLIVIGCLLLLDGKSQLGELLAIGQLLYGVNFMLNNIGRFMMDFKASEPAVDRVLELMEERTEKSGTEVADGTGSLHQTVNEKRGIKLDDVVFTHRNGNKVLDQASLSVEQGELAALIGPSGEGKSTVIKLLMGFYEPLKGDISVAGQRLAQSDLELWRSNIAYVPQNSFLFEGSIAENIRFGKPEASDEEIAAAAESACAHEFIMELPEGYSTIISENSTNLSGGQRQRIALARAFIKKAPVLLLDEATSALDFETEKRIIQSLNKLMGKQTVLMISHRPTAYTGFSHVFTLRQGKLERL